MIDFMVNIKNKKNMIKCNIKTLMATSVLCVFFNVVLIYGTENNDDNDTNNNNKEESFFKIEVLQDEDDTQKKEKILEAKKDNLDNFKIRKKKKKIKDNILLNFEGDISLLFCFNLCNGKEENVEKYFQKPIDEDQDYLDYKQISGELKDFDNTNQSPNNPTHEQNEEPIPLIPSLGDDD